MKQQIKSTTWFLIFCEFIYKQQHKNGIINAVHSLTRVRTVLVFQKPRQKSETDNSALLESVNEPVEPEPTYMELAMRAAMEKARDKKQKQDTRKNKSTTTEQDEILARTLENKVQTS